MRRREFVTFLGAIAVTHPVRARAQQADRARRIGMLLPYAQKDPEAKAHLSAFTLEIKRLGLVGGSQHSCRHQFRGRNRGRISIASKRAGCASTRPAPFGVDARRRRATAGDAGDPDRVCRGLGSCRLGFRRQLGATRGQSHRHDAVREWHRGEVAPDALSPSVPAIQSSA
jgi:hypothetical protein